MFEYLFNRGKSLNLGDVQVIARDILLSLHQIHSKGIMHLDLNPLNLLVLDNIEHNRNNDLDFSSQIDMSVVSSGNASANAGNQRLLHLTNFCISSGFLRKKFSSNLISSLYFMSPERICGEIECENEYVCAKSDVWSVRVLLFLLVFGKPPFDGKMTTSLVKAVKNGNIKLKDN